jgi:transposase InsO family protein
MKRLRLEYGYPVEKMSNVFGVSKSGYYAWLLRRPSKRQEESARLETIIKAAHERGRGTYGPERLQEELAKVDGVNIGRGKLKRVRRKLGIRCKQVRKFKATTNSRHKLPIANNLLEQNFASNRPGEIWVADITYIATDEGWLYLAGIKDLFNGEIVGYSMNERMTRELVGKALFSAVKAKRPSEGLIHHSDRGSQYCSRDYQRLLKQFGIQSSMSGKGNCYDNAPMESFWGTLKNELVHHQRYRTRQEAIQQIREYIEIFYNRQRRQKRLGYLSPIAFEKNYYKEIKAA